MKAMPVVLVVCIFGAAFAFYWYEYRPSQIRAECETFSIESATEEFKESLQKQLLGKLLPKGSAEGLYNVDSKNAYYLSCVRQGGLEN